MSSPYERHIRLDGAHNVRDLGGYSTAGGRTTRWRSFLRADALHELSAGDVDVLLQLGLRSVIDLRSDVELARQPSAFAGHSDVQYHHIPLFHGLSPVDAMMTASGEFDLALRYVDAADRCRTALLAVMTTIAQAEEGVVLFNCTAGKDRTGIVAAMLLSLAGVADDEIVADYSLTQQLAAALMERLKAQAVRRGLPEAAAARLLSSEPATMMALLTHIGGRYGGFRTYLATEPGSDDHIARVEARLLA